MGVYSHGERRPRKTQEFHNLFESIAVTTWLMGNHLGGTRTISSNTWPTSRCDCWLNLRSWPYSAVTSHPASLRLSPDDAFLRLSPGGEVINESNRKKILFFMVFSHFIWIFYQRIHKYKLIFFHLTKGVGLGTTN